MSTRFYSEALARHDRGSFRSGNPKIDAYFQTVVTQDIKRQYVSCYVVIDRETKAIAGYYTLSTHSIMIDEIPAASAKKLPRYPHVPAMLIGRLGRDKIYHSQGLGKMLLADAVIRIRQFSIGCYAICVEAIDDYAVEFYLKHGFTASIKYPKKLYIPMKTAETLLA